MVFPSFLMLTAISNLFGVGGASAIARVLGKKEPDRARQIASVSFWGGLVMGILFALLFWLLELPLPTVLSKYHRALKKMRAYLEGDNAK